MYAVSVLKQVSTELCADAWAMHPGPGMQQYALHEKNRPDMLPLPLPSPPPPLRMADGGVFGVRMNAGGSARDFCGCWRWGVVPGEVRLCAG